MVSQRPSGVSTTGACLEYGLSVNSNDIYRSTEAVRKGFCGQNDQKHSTYQSLQYVNIYFTSQRRGKNYSIFQVYIMTTYDPPHTFLSYGTTLYIISQGLDKQCFPNLHYLRGTSLLWNVSGKLLCSQECYKS